MTVAFWVSPGTWVVGSWAALDALQSLDEGTKFVPTGTVVPGVGRHDAGGRGGNRGGRRPRGRQMRRRQAGCPQAGVIAGVGLVAGLASWSRVRPVVGDVVAVPGCSWPWGCRRPPGRRRPG